MRGRLCAACRQQGFNEYGEERCIRKAGCAAPPMPELSLLDRVAWRAFQGCATQWEVGIGGRVGLRYSDVRVWAEAHGFALNAALLSRVQRLEALKMMDDDHQRGERTDAGGYEESVN